MFLWPRKSGRVTWPPWKWSDPDPDSYPCFSCSRTTGNEFLGKNIFRCFFDPRSREGPHGPPGSDLRPAHTHVRASNAKKPLETILQAKSGFDVPLTSTKKRRDRHTDKLCFARPSLQSREYFCIYLPSDKSIYLPTYLPTHPAIYLAIYLFIYLPTYLPTYLPIFISGLGCEGNRVIISLKYVMYCFLSEKGIYEYWLLLLEEMFFA